ncbi:MAG TPA: ABC transporter ATP-binding protein [Thermoanaerobaculia bacterium]|nr:ABC transporter ATP-binding protein [Thermoanaerobaculia bacterium]
MEVLVRIENVKKIYRRDEFDVPVLNGVSVEVGRGDFLALMGPSGSGKTTLLNLIAGIDRPTGGRIIVEEKEISRFSETALASWRARHVGFIFQLYNLIPVLNAFENVELPLLLTRLSKKERREHVTTALNIVGLSDRMFHYPRQLSGGQEQRVAIARAIVTDPTIIVADEPTGDLDARNAEDVLNLLARLNDEFQKTIIMVTHDPKAANHARRTLHLEKGLLVEMLTGSGIATVSARAEA